MRALLALAALVVIAAAFALGRPPSDTRDRARRAPTSTLMPTPSTPITTPAPPRLSRAQINRQDRTSRRHRTREAHTFDKRPLLTRLPLERDGIRIDIAGLATDDRTTVLAVDPGHRSRTHARRVYESALRQTRDDGSAYVLEWTR